MSGDGNIFETALAQLAEYEAKAYDLKAWINQGLAFQGKPPMFPDLAAPGSAPAKRGLTIGVDDFFNKPMATAVREVLAMRKDAGMVGPASIDDIHAALVQGGFNFPSNDIDKQKMGLAVSLGKNTVTFRKLPSGLFGLAEWYGANSRPAVRRRGVASSDPDHAPESGGEEVPDDFERLLEGADQTRDGDAAPPNATPYSADEDGREVEHDNMNH